MKKNIICLFLITQVFAFGGLGVYGNLDMFSSTASKTSNGTVSVTPQSLNGAKGIGIFFYLDVIPVIDLEIDYELVGNLYKFTTNLSDEPGEFPWGRISGYYTIRKEIIGTSIPLLAKVQVYGGLGFNNHTVTPNVTIDLIDKAYTGDIVDNATQDFSDDEIMKSLLDYIDDNKINKSGFHIQIGAQGKLLMLNLFINARYTIVSDVIEDKSGFPSLWTGLAIGF